MREDDEKLKIPILKIDAKVGEGQIKKLKEMKEKRDQDAVTASLNALRKAANDSTNLMPRFIECAKAYATVGEMIDVLRVEFGEYKEQPIF